MKRRKGNKNESRVLGKGRTMRSPRDKDKKHGPDVSGKKKPTEGSNGGSGMCMLSCACQWWHGAEPVCQKQIETHLVRIANISRLAIVLFQDV